MYGLIVENVLGYIRTHYHPKRYEEIIESVKLPKLKDLDISKVSNVIKIGY